jgi:hypothetical protein
MDIVINKPKQIAQIVDLKQLTEQVKNRREPNGKSSTSTTSRDAEGSNDGNVVFSKSPTNLWTNTDRRSISTSRRRYDFKGSDSDNGKQWGSNDRQSDTSFDNDPINRPSNGNNLKSISGESEQYVSASATIGTDIDDTERNVSATTEQNRKKHYSSSEQGIGSDKSISRMVISKDLRYRPDSIELIFSDDDEAQLIIEDEEEANRITTNSKIKVNKNKIKRIPFVFFDDGVLFYEWREMQLPIRENFEYHTKLTNFLDGIRPTGKRSSITYDVVCSAQSRYFTSLASLPTIQVKHVGFINSIYSMQGRTLVRSLTPSELSGELTLIGDEYMETILNEGYKLSDPHMGLRMVNCVEYFNNRTIIEKVVIPNEGLTLLDAVMTMVKHKIKKWTAISMFFMILELFLGLLLSVLTQVKIPTEYLNYTTLGLGIIQTVIATISLSLKASEKKATLISQRQLIISSLSEMSDANDDETRLKAFSVVNKVVTALCAGSGHVAMIGGSPKDILEREQVSIISADSNLIRSLIK